jgi:hypothetical protein
MKNHAFRNRGWGRSFEDADAGTEGAELDGLRVVFDQKVGLHPANLQKTLGPTIRKPKRRMAPGMMWRGAALGG